MITAYRPDRVVDPEYPDFAENLRAFGEITGEDVSSLPAICARIEKRRAFFREAGATSTDHGHPTAVHRGSAPRGRRGALRARFAPGSAQPADAELFRGQMLTEMARMSVEDGMVLQIHPGVYRSHDPAASGAFRPRQGRRHSACDGICAEPQAAARSLRQRAKADGHPLHARREQLFARARAAGRPLSGAEARPAVVVPRQPRRHAPLPRAGHRNGRASTIRSASSTTRAPSCRSPRGTTLRGGWTAASSRASSPSTGSTRTRRTRSRGCSPTSSTKEAYACERAPLRSDALEAAEDLVKRPYDGPAKAGVVHIGIGAFHRAHQAAVIRRAGDAGDLRWGIVGASLRSAAVRDALLPQQGLYSLVVERRRSASTGA